jgi:hypothetical protein
MRRKNFQAYTGVYALYKASDAIHVSMYNTHLNLHLIQRFIQNIRAPSARCITEPLIHADTINFEIYIRQ